MRLIGRFNILGRLKNHLELQVNLDMICGEIARAEMIKVSIVIVIYVEISQFVFTSRESQFQTLYFRINIVFVCDFVNIYRH